MQPEFWQQRWKANQIGFHQDQINPWLVEFWPQLEIPEHARVLVPLAGKSLDMWWLSEQGHTVLGVELSPVAVGDFFEATGVTPERSNDGPFQRCEANGVSLLCGDFFALTTEHLKGVAAVYDRASLVAFPPPMRPDYAAHLQQILPPSCPVLLITMEYPAEQMQGPPFPVDEDEVQQLFGERFSIDKLAEAGILGDMPQFRDRGLTSLTEKIFKLSAIT